MITSWPPGTLNVLPMEIPSTSPLPTGPGRMIAAGVRNQLFAQETAEELIRCECW